MLIFSTEEMDALAKPYKWGVLATGETRGTKKEPPPEGSGSFARPKIVSTELMRSGDL
jgi:hypothetical protein